MPYRIDFMDRAGNLVFPSYTPLGYLGINIAFLERELQWKAQQPVSPDNPGLVVVEIRRLSDNRLISRWERAEGSTEPLSRTYQYIGP